MLSIEFGWFDWFRNTHQPVKPRRYSAEERAFTLPLSRKYAYTLAYTPALTAKKPAENSCIRLLQATHNPLVLGSNPSGPSFRARAGSQAI